MRVLAALALIVCLPAVAAADEGITLLRGDTAAVKGTEVACAVGAASIRCIKTGGLAATLSATGKVRVTKGSRVLFPRSTATAGARHLRLAVYDGFSVGGTPIECHVYVQGVKTMSCSTINAKGGLPKSYGFDMSDRSVIVFRYGAIADRHVVKSFPQP